MRILISTDGSAFSLAAVEKCCQIIARPDLTSIKIVSPYEVIEPIDISISPEFSRELEDSARKQAEEFAERSAAIIQERFPDSKIDLSLEISMGAPDLVLVKTAKQWRADLIVVGSHGRSYWKRKLLGSIPDSLIHNAPCSVLVVRKNEY